MHYSGKIHEIFKKLANAQPSAPAVITDDRVITYAELDAAADQLTLELHRRGIANQEAIGVLVERSADLPKAFLAILKAGGVYVPMVANIPAERLANFAKQAAIRRLIVLDGIMPQIELIDALIANGAIDASDAIIRPEKVPEDGCECVPPSNQTENMTDLAVILFTSGSTGIPKGVMIQHDACANMVHGHIAAHDIRPSDRILLSTSPGFILGFREVCLPFASGSAYVPASRSTLDQPDQLLALMSRHRVSIALFTPSYLRLLNGTVPEGLRLIITAGERPNADDARHYARYIDYWSIYGATETCGTICMKHVAPEGEGPIPGGKLFPNTTVCLLDENGNEVPEGEIGEIYATGVIVSRGYVNQSELTAESFVETPHGRAFRTHDLARWNQNGELETLGRADDVVKISGQKVSLGEIERTLLHHPYVRRAAAFQIKGLLVACVECPDSGGAERVDWREFVGRTLPSYMIPAQVAALPTMPISSAGKINRLALIEIADSIFTEARKHKVGTPPQNDLERAIAGIWEDVLGQRPIMREDNFFIAGGTSLLAIAVSQRLQLLGYKVTVQMVLSSLTVEKLAARISAMQKPELSKNEDLPAENIATTDQEDFWIASEIGLAPTASHIVRVFSIHGRIIQPDTWQSAWTNLINRHAALRTAFYSDEKGRIRWRTFEISKLPQQMNFSFDHCKSIEAAKDIITQNAKERFLLTEPPLVRAGLIEVDCGSEILFWYVFHHSVVDGSSARLIMEDLLALLGQSPMPAAPHGVAIASLAEKQYLDSDLALRDREFWQASLDTLVSRGREAFDEYITERQRPALPSGLGTPPLVEKLDQSTVAVLSRLAKAQGTGLHALLLAILAHEIRRRSGLKDVIVGSGISLRPAGGERAIGHFVNPLPVILPYEADASFSELLRITQSSLTETVEHAAYPVGLLYREFRLRHPDLRARLRTSLFDIALTANDPRTFVDKETGLTLEPRPLPGELEHPAAGLDFSFSHEPCPEDGGGLKIHLTWNQDVCSLHTAGSWLSSFASWARWLASNPDRIEEPLPILLPCEENQFKQWESGPDMSYPYLRAHEVFEEVADRQPDSPAVIGRDYIETYASLDARANGIAHQLIAQGVVSGDTVAVIATASVNLPAAALAVWKAGGTYLPLVHDLPAARMATMVKDSGAKALIALDGLTVPGLLADSVGAIIRPEECAPSGIRPHSDGSPEDVAYIVYTSGTTGMPKGVPLMHAGYVNIIMGIARTVNIRPDDRMSLIATVGFDASLWELGHGLMNGIALVPISQALRDDPWLLKRYYHEQGVTVAFHTPSYLRVSEQIPFEGMRILLIGGEPPNYRDVQHYAGHSEFWNVYGPTETTIVVAAGRVFPDHDPDVTLTIGRPFPNLIISLRREDGSRVPPGVQGELWLSGVGVGRDYLNRPELTKTSFVNTEEGRFYRSGDYGRWSKDGCIEIIGRIDHQIKLNGQRIELGEIEQVLRTHPAVADAVVLVDELATGTKVLRAFIRPNGITPSETALIEFLSGTLPVHMLPASITQVDVIPLNASGKIDRLALMNLVKQQLETLVKEAPRDEFEMRVAAIWAEVLGVPVVARSDNFFALGGNSLLAVKLAHRVSEVLGIKVSARLLFAAPALAAFVGKIGLCPDEEAGMDASSETDFTTEGEQEFWTAETVGLDTRTFTIPVHYLVIGEVAPDRWQSAWSALIARHEGLRTYFEEDAKGRLIRRIKPAMDVTLEFAVMPDKTTAMAHIRQRQADSLLMNTAPLWRAGIVKVQEDGTNLIWLALHHAIGDGQSVGTLFNELPILLADGVLPPPGDGGRLFASREQSYLATSDSTRDAEYWRVLLRGVPDAAFDEWSLDAARSAKNPPGNHRLDVVLDSRTTEALKAIARSHDASLHSLMLVLLAMEARRRTGRTNILIGTPASIRESLSDARIVGYGVNLLPLHLRSSEKQSFGELLRSTQQSLASVLQHARYPFARIYRTFFHDHPGVRHPQRYPIFDLAITENPEAGQAIAPRRFIFPTKATGNVSYEHTDVAPGQDILLLHEILGGGELLLQLHVNAAIYSEKTARAWFNALASWACWLASNPHLLEEPLPPLLPCEEAQIKQWERGTDKPYPNRRVHEIFEELVYRQPDSPAIIGCDYRETYVMLDARANGIAHRLITQGVVSGTTVAVLATASVNLPAVVLGIWKAGGTYLPLVHDMPAERMAAMVKDSGAKVVVAIDGFTVPGLLVDSVGAIIRPEDCPPSDQHPHSDGSPEDVAYIIYTSGTTGIPKGVPVPHKGYINSIQGAADLAGIRPSDRISLIATVGFDASVWELGHGLMDGIALVPVSQVLRDDPWLLKRYYLEQGVTVAFHTPSYLRISEQTPFEGLRILFTGGEPPNYRDVQYHASQSALWNCYGPAETSILVSMEKIESKRAQDIPVTAGRPLPNVIISLRSEDGSRVPPGVRGELWLGGIGVARGYLNRPELTKASFINTGEGRFYRSGDYGRWSKDGCIEIIGRIDHQIKLNGQRVELGEIEQALRTHPAIADAVVLVDEPATGAKVLRAFIRSKGTAPSEAAIMEFISGTLPVHMLPASITQVAAIPLSASGKVDRIVLLNKVKQQLETLLKEAPQGGIEMSIAAIWAELLSVPRVARSDNFFALGGNSLLAVKFVHRVSESLGIKVSARSVFAAPTLAAFVQGIKVVPAKAEPKASIIEKDIVTEGEREFWIAEAAGLDTRTFTIPFHYRVIGDVSPDRWHSAWSMVVARHEGLQTFFEEDATGQLRRRIAKATEVKLEFAVVPDKAAALAHIRQRQADPLPMNIPPLWRVGLASVQQDGTHFFWLALHHAVGDGQSLGLLLNELTTLLTDGSLPHPGDSGKVFAFREQSYFASKDAIRDAQYWNTLLKRIPATAFNDWPLDIARSSRTPSGNHRLEMALNSLTAEGLKAIARNHDASLHSLMLALFAMEVRRRTGRPDIIIGTTSSIREFVSDERIVGYGVNMLPLHLKPVSEQSFGDLLRETQNVLALALQHARYPFARIYRAFWSEHPEVRHPQRYPIFDIAVTENPGSKQDGTPQIFERGTMATQSVSYERTNASPGQDLVLIHEVLGDGELLLQLQVNAAIYSEETARAWFDALAGWAHWLAEYPARATYPLPKLLPEEEVRLAGWERGDAIDRPQLRFHELVETVVDRPGQADYPAVITKEGVMSYGALEEEANAIAHALISRGVKHGSIVGVLTKRSCHLPAAALGVWKAGAIYLPIASDLPSERMTFMVSDAGVSQLIALDGFLIPESLKNKIPGVLRPEELSEKFRQEHKERIIVAGKPDDTAYILYTSGSTGVPKGTLISHKSYVNMVLGAAGIYGLTSDDRCLMFASPSFDVSLSDMGVPLYSGAAICPAPANIVESPGRFLDFLRDLGVTVVDITPTYLRLFDCASLPSSVRVLVTGGEPPVPADVKRYAEKLRYFNAYGPTENTITSTMGILQAEEIGIIAAGRPLPNTSAYICDSEGNPLPPGVMGEIWLGGMGLSHGYLNRPELTERNFVKTPWGRRYRTGDLGRWKMDGTIEIAGRIDEQIKLNGIRIELGEIEHALASHEAISQAVALLISQASGSKSLWAVVRLLPGQKMPGEVQWRAHLAERLPSHMIPSGVIEAAVIPLMTSGKVDRSALLALFADRPMLEGLMPPQDDLERSVAEVWEAVLGHSNIHREDNFFALGGHSLLAIAVAHRLEKLLGREIPARELFAEPTLAGFAERLRAAGDSEEFSREASSDLATIGQREFWTAELAGLETSGFNISVTLTVDGDMPSDERWRSSWNDLIMRHEALRTGFYEDDSCVLRRIIVAQPQAHLEIHTASNNYEALKSIRTRQSETFSMSNPGLWRAGLTHVADNGQAIFWFVMHHAIGDGLSLGILIDELTALLRGDRLSPQVDSFNKTAAREAAYLESKTAKADAAYWQFVVGGLTSRAPDAFDEWPLDRPRPKTQTAASRKGGHCFCSRLDKKTVNGLRTLAKRNGATMHALVLAILRHEVRRRTGRSEFLLGTAASTRHSAAEARTVGYYINMLPLSCRVDVAESIDTAVRATQKALAEALQHSLYPFARIYGDFRREHPQATNPSRYPLFDIGVTENPATGASPETGLRFTGLVMREPGIINYELRHNAPPQDMVLIHEGEPDGGLVLTLFVNADIYTQDTAGHWFNSLIGWTQFLADNLDETGKLLPELLPEEEKLLSKWQKGPSCPMPATSFPELFRTLALTYPDRPALITDVGEQSYATVNARADALACSLLALDIKHGEPIAVLTQRSSALPEAAMAIWKAGGCYLPLTADLPAERLAFMATDAGVRVIIALDGLAIPPELSKENYKIIRPEEKPTQLMPGDLIKLINVGKAISPADPAYILYTSGSTGQPKGVILCHGGMLNLGVGEAEILGINSLDRTLMMSSPSFDLWISDLVMTWMVGGAVAPIRREAMNDISGMKALIQRLGITAVTTSPSYLHLFEQADFPGLRLLMTVGESPFPDDARHYAIRLLYFNGYGPTENTAGTTYSRVSSNAEMIAAGRPICNTSVYIVNDNGKPLPPGVTGEIWVGGAGLATGYLNRPDLTAAGFVDIAGERRYRTGDLGRWLRSGELLVLGRLDTQVKLRGQRVELGEIEHRLASYPGVLQAVAIVDTLTDQTQILRSFVTIDPQASAPTEEVLRAYLSEGLPSYMIPSTIHRVATIPLSAAGKVDRQMLLNTMNATAGFAASPVSNAEGLLRTPPQTAIEKRISEVWAEQLGLPFVAREDNFFEQGGNSLKAIAAIGKLRREFECRVNDLYEHPVLADFARFCRPRPDHLRAIVRDVSAAWEEGRGVHAGSEAERKDALSPQRTVYEAKISAALERDLAARQPYRNILLTGATGYLGSYLLRELLACRKIRVTALVRGSDNKSARTRLGRVLVEYFGAKAGRAMLQSKRLNVLASDLRHPQLLLSSHDYGQLVETIDAIYHCAANVNHFGHYRDFYADNVAATRHLLTLAASRKPAPADFHFVSTLSVAGQASTDGFRLFTEYDLVPEVADDNYYIRTKQEAERLVIAARAELKNACIYRIGNISFATDSTRLQRNIADNAFFRQLVSFIQLGVVPVELNASLCYVDVVARAIASLAGTAALINETHHIETSRQDRLADFIRTDNGMAKRVRACDFGAFLGKLQEAIDEPQMESALAETVETFGLQSSRSHLVGLHRLVITSDRTHALLEKLGITWPAIPEAGQSAMLQAALKDNEPHT